VQGLAAANNTPEQGEGGPEDAPERFGEAAGAVLAGSRCSIP